MNCPKCDYEWKSRVTTPKACPKCKYRLDYPRKSQDINVTKA